MDFLNFFTGLFNLALHSPWSWAGMAGLCVFGFTWTTKTDNVTTVQAADVNNLQSEKLDRDGAIDGTGPQRLFVKDIYGNFTADTDLSAVPTACYGQIYTNIGTAQNIEIDLPAAVVGMGFVVRVSAAFTIKLDPNGTDIIDIVTDAAGDYLLSDAVIGTFLQLKCEVAGHWVVWGMNGSWTEE